MNDTQTIAMRRSGWQTVLEIIVAPGSVCGNADEVSVGIVIPLRDARRATIGLLHRR